MGQYRTGRNNRKELIYWQPGPEKSDDDELRFVIVRGPLTAQDVCDSLNFADPHHVLEQKEG